jgi:2-polyprenyl-6-methoxyphenol hydroxylase-like FAD-dependent oxidoreductase
LIELSSLIQFHNLNPPHTKTQVVIIGAGPTGLTLAAQLIRHDIDFVILEKNEKPTHLSKAIAIQARSLEIFQEMGIAEEALRRGQLTTGMRLFYKGKQKIALDLGRLGEGLSEFTFALSLEQSKTEKLLAEFVTEKGRSIHWAHEFSHFEETASGITVYYKNTEGIEGKIEASYLVGCDGASSPVRHQLGLSFEGTTEPKFFYVADVILTSPVINTDALCMFMIRKGFVLFFPMEGQGHYRIVGVLPDPDETEGDYTFAEVEPLIKNSIVSPVNFEELRWFSAYRVHSRKAGSFIKARCFIAGDAAHIHTPAGGQGMNTGIQDAYNLAWKLAYRLRNEVNDEVLNTYDSERSANAKRLLETTDRIFDFMTGVNRFWNFIRLSLFPLLMKLMAKNKFVQRRVFPLVSQIGISYPDSYLSSKSSVGKVKAGDRMHYFVFSNGRNIFSYLTEPVFKLLYFGNEVKDNPMPGTKIKMSFISFEEIPKVIFGNTSGFYVLLRPDNHVCYIGKELDKCRELLNKIKSESPKTEVRSPKTEVRGPKTEVRGPKTEVGGPRPHTQVRSPNSYFALFLFLLSNG